MNVSELLDQTVAYFMGSGSSRFNSQVNANFMRCDNKTPVVDFVCHYLRQEIFTSSHVSIGSHPLFAFSLSPIPQFHKLC